MKKICMINQVAMAAAFLEVHAAPIQSYQELTAAIQDGKRLVFLLNLQECTGKPGMPIGYFTPTEIMLMPASETLPERVVTSFLHFTEQSGKPVYEFVKFILNSDGTIAIRTAFYNPQNFEAIGLPHTLNCRMGEGIEIQAD